MLSLIALFIYFMDMYSKFTMLITILFICTVIYYCLVLLRIFAGSIDDITFESEGTEKCKQKFRNIANKWVICITLLMVLLPSSKTVYISSGLILGQQMIHKAENSELLNKSYKVLEIQMNKYLDEYLIEKPQTK